MLFRSGECAFRKKSYSVDFIGGLLHFLVFFAWAVTVMSHSYLVKGEISSYIFLLAVVILYDNVWYFASYSSNERSRIERWRDQNNLNFVACVALYALSRFCGADIVLSEHLTLFPVLGFSLRDLSSMIEPKAEAQPQGEQQTPRTNGAAS